MVMDAYTEGQRAFEDDIEILDNPYQPMSADWNDWRKGWTDASENDWSKRKEGHQ